MEDGEYDEVREEVLPALIIQLRWIFWAELAFLTRVFVRFFAFSRFNRGSCASSGTIGASTFYAASLLASRFFWTVRCEHQGHRRVLVQRMGFQQGSAARRN